MDDESIDSSDWVIQSDKLLGSGAWSHVYYASQPMTGLVAACKVILKNTIEKLRLARNEIAILTEIHHANIIKLQSVINKQDRYELFLEYFPEGDLYERTNKMKDYNLPYHECKSIGRQIASAINYLHGRDIVHRDIKADNILMRGDKAVLCDMGLSRRLERSNEYLFDWVGSPMYASPELINRIPYRKGPDVWAFGVLLYLIVTGDIPFDETEENKDGLAMVNVHEPPNYNHKLLTDGCIISLLRTIFVLIEKKRASIEEVIQHEWFAP